MHTRPHRHELHTCVLVHAFAAGKQIAGQETHERKWQTGVRYAPAKKKIGKISHTKKVCLLFESSQVKFASQCVCVCNKYIHASQTHAQFTPIQTRQVYMQKINTIRTHPQTTAHQLHIHRTACRCVCYTWRHRLMKSK